MLALLMAMTTRLACCDSIPVAPMNFESSMNSPFLRAAQVGDRAIEHGDVALQYFLTGLEMPYGFLQRDHLVHGHDVRGLRKSLADARGVRDLRRRRIRIGRRIQAVTDLLE